MRKLIIAVTIALVSMTGCSILGGGIEYQDEERNIQGTRWSVLGSNENWAFNESDRVCGYGYYVIEEYPNRPLPPLYFMEIVCKGEESGLVDVVNNPVEAKELGPNGEGDIGRYSFQIERTRIAKSCNPEPIAILDLKEAGVETYHITCSDESQIKFSCSANVCNVIR